MYALTVLAAGPGAPDVVKTLLGDPDSRFKGTKWIFVNEVDDDFAPPSGVNHVTERISMTADGNVMDEVSRFDLAAVRYYEEESNIALILDGTMPQTWCIANLARRHPKISDVFYLGKNKQLQQLVNTS